MPGQILNEGDVSSVVQQVGAVGMSQDVGRHWFVDARLCPQHLEVLGQIIAVPTPWGTCGYEQRRAVVATVVEKLLDPVKRGLGKENHPGLFALADDLHLRLAHFERRALESQGFGNTKSSTKENLD